MPRKPFLFSYGRDYRTAGQSVTFEKEGAGDLVPYGKGRRFRAKATIGFPDSYDADRMEYTPTKMFVVSRPKKKKSSFFGLFRRTN